MVDDLKDTLAPIPESEDPAHVLYQFARELRHPITAITGWADLILTGKYDPQDAAKMIYDVAANMEVLRSAVLNYVQARSTLK